MHMYTFRFCIHIYPCWKAIAASFNRHAFWEIPGSLKKKIGGSVAAEKNIPATGQT